MGPQSPSTIHGLAGTEGAANAEDTSEYAPEYYKALEEMVSQIVSDDTGNSFTEALGGRFLLSHPSQAWTHARAIELSDFAADLHLNNHLTIRGKNRDT